MSLNTNEVEYFFGKWPTDELVGFIYSIAQIFIFRKIYGLFIYLLIINHFLFKFRKKYYFLIIIFNWEIPLLTNYMSFGSNNGLYYENKS